MAVSRPIPNEVPIAKQVKSGVVFCDSCNSFFFCIAHKHHHIKSSPAWYALQVGRRETVSSKMPTSAIAILTYAHYSKPFKHFRTCYGWNWTSAIDGVRPALPTELHSLKDPPWYASLRGLTGSDIRPNALLREAGRIYWDYYTTICAKRKAASSGIACRFVAFVESALNMRPTYT